MTAQIQEDHAKRPDLFHFGGPIIPAQLNDWLQERNLAVPEDLKRLWCEMGGGDMFESETILSPFGVSDLADDVDSVNAFHWRQGMPSDYLIFHTGLGGLSVIEMQVGRYASVREGSYQVEQTFESLSDWYARLIRKEYASRYGLT
jgi:hypothetical protein